MFTFVGATAARGLHREVVADGDGRVVREFLTLVDGLGTRQRGGGRCGQVVADASKNPRLAGL